MADYDYAEPEYSQFPAMLSDKDFIVDSDDEDKPGPFSDDEKEEEKEEEEENLDEDLGVCNQYLFASPTADKQKREIERAKEKYRKKLAQKATYALDYLVILTIQIGEEEIQPEPPSGRKCRTTDSLFPRGYFR